VPDAPKDAPKEPPKDAPKGVAQPPKNLEPIPKDSAITVLGKKVLGPSGEDMGRVTDLLLDRDAHIKSIVIDFGGFLGVGSRKIAIDWRLVRFMPDNAEAPIALSLGKAEVQAAPEYKDSAQPPVMVGPPPSGPDAAR
jgi:sporulation protein YlmC with PRC-barrel domain